jgi:hypothetical protein
MNNNNHIRSLTEKFMKGDTSLTEEQELYRYFSGNDIAEDLLPLRPSVHRPRNTPFDIR